MMVLLAALVAAPVTLQADPAHSSASFSVKHMMVSTVRGDFAVRSSTLVWDKDDPSKSSVEAKLDPATVDTHNEKRDAHLKSPDFFDTARCPDVSFKSNKIEKAGDKYNVTGDLTLHCVTKPVTLTAEATGPVKSPFGPFNSYGVSATGTLNRKDFGLVWNKALESGGVVVSEDVKLALDLEYSDAQAGKPETKAEKKAATKK